MFPHTGHKKIRCCNTLLCAVRKITDTDIANVATYPHNPAINV